MYSLNVLKFPFVFVAAEAAAAAERNRLRAAKNAECDRVALIEGGIVDSFGIFGRIELLHSRRLLHNSDSGRNIFCQQMVLLAAGKSRPAREKLFQSFHAFSSYLLKFLIRSGA